VNSKQNLEFGKPIGGFSIALGYVHASAADCRPVEMPPIPTRRHLELAGRGRDNPAF